MLRIRQGQDALQACAGLRVLWQKLDLDCRWVDGRYQHAAVHSFADVRGKAFRQHRPDGLLVSHEQMPRLVSATTNFLISVFASASAFVTPKQ